MDKKNSFDVQRATNASLSVQQHDVGDDVVAGFVSRVKSLFPIRDALRPELGRAHYREILSGEG